MNRKILLPLFLFIVSITFILYGCTTQSTSPFSYPTTTLSHWGFDFSAGIRPTVYTNNDGEIINWVPSPGTPTSSESWSTNLWFRPSTNTTTENFINYADIVSNIKYYDDLRP